MTPASRAGIVLRANLGDHPAFMPLKTGAIATPGLRFNFCGPKSPPSGFKDMVRAGAYDVGELALGTYLQAVAYRKPVILLPLTITARLQHHMILRRASDPFPPAEAAGKRIGVRSYSQTTGIWVRAILSETYGVDPAAIQWMCTEGAHVAEYMDPPNVTRMAVPASRLADLLLDGTLDAAIFGADLPTDNPELVPLIADPHAAAQQWYAAHGYVPVNHMLAVTSELATRHPDAVRRIYRLFAEARKAAPESSDGIDYLPIGFDALRAPVEAMIAHAFEQNIIPRKLTFAEVFEDAQRLLEG